MTKRHTTYALLSALLLSLLGERAAAFPMPTKTRAQQGRSSKEAIKVKVRRIDQIKPTSTTAPPPKTALVGTHRVLVVMIEPEDVRFADGAKERVDKLFFADDGSSMRHFYKENSYGAYELEGEVLGPIKVPGKLASYAYTAGSDGAAVSQLIKTAFAGVAGRIDMGRFDTHDQFGRKKSDGAVDHFAVIFPAPKPGYAGYFAPIWPHRGTLEVEVSGKKLSSYYIFSDALPLGAYVHEHGHDIGLPDLYDRDDSSHGAGEWCTMAAGSWLGDGHLPGHISAFGKIKMGWVRPDVVARSQARIEIPAVETSPTVLKIPIGKADSPEYFLVENRQRIGYDAELPDEGLLVWHIDESKSDNDDEGRKLVDVVEPSSIQDLDVMFKDRDPDRIDTFRAGRKTRFADDTTPSAKTNAGAASGIVIDDISASKSVMTASLTVPTLQLPDGEPYVLFEDNYQFGSFGFVALPKGSEELVRLTATPGAYDAGGIEALVVASRAGKVELTLTFYADQGGKPGKKLHSQPVQVKVPDTTYTWLKAGLTQPLRLEGGKAFWVGLKHAGDQVGVAYNPASVSKQARFRQKDDKLKDKFNFASGPEPVPDYIVRVHGYGFIGVAAPEIPAQADEGDELVKRMREADALLDKKKFLEAQAIYESILPRMSQDAERFATWIPVVQNALGVAAYQAGHYGVAADAFLTSLRRAQKLGDKRAEADIMQNICETYFLGRELEPARKFCAGALELNRGVPDRLLESTYWLGRIAYAQGNADEGKGYIDACPALVEEVHKDDPALKQKWLARLERAKSGKAEGEDPLDAEHSLAAEQDADRKAESQEDAKDKAAGGGGGLQIDMADFGGGN